MADTLFLYRTVAVVRQYIQQQYNIPVDTSWAQQHGPLGGSSASVLGAQASLQQSQPLWLLHMAYRQLAVQKGSPESLDLALKVGLGS